jgi:hypothetical protein
MLHTNQRRMQDEMLEDPSELIVDSPTHHAALYTNNKGDSVLMVGDLSGDDQDTKVRRFAEQMKRTNGRY